MEKKKIAIIFRGPIRPDVNSVISNIRELKKSFSSFEIDTYLMTWNNSIDLSSLSLEIDNIIALKEPDIDFISQQLVTRTKQNSLFDRNYKAFWSVKNAIKLVIDTCINYEWIVLSRTDLFISINNIDKWLNNDVYTMPSQENYIINDQFGIASPDIMSSAWNYVDMKTLNKLYGESFNPEDCLKKIMEMNNIKSIKISANSYKLNIKRHFDDISYPKDLLVSEIKHNRKINKALIGLKKIIKKIISVFYEIK